MITSRCVWVRGLIKNSVIFLFEYVRKYVCFLSLVFKLCVLFKAVCYTVVSGMLTFWMTPLKFRKLLKVLLPVMQVCKLIYCFQVLLNYFFYKWCSIDMSTWEINWIAQTEGQDSSLEVRKHLDLQVFSIWAKPQTCQWTGMSQKIFFSNWINEKIIYLYNKQLFI